MIKYKYVDALRGLAIIAVLIVHSGQLLHNKLPHIYLSIINYGQMGVQLFYVASAFTLFLSLNQRAQVETSLVKNFFIRRFFRIAPMYYIAIIYYLFQNGLSRTYRTGDIFEITNWDIVSNISFLHGFNPYWINSLVPGGWSVAIEMMFYCMLPGLVLYIKNLNQAVAFFLATVTLNLILASFFKSFSVLSGNVFWSDYLYFYFPNQLPVFACGIIMYFMITTPRADWKVNPTLLLLLTGSIMISLATEISLFPYHILFAGAFVILGYALSKKEFTFLVNPITTHLGKISFSMYLVHVGVLHWMPKLSLTHLLPTGTGVGFIANSLLVLVVFFLLTVGISTVFYQLIEIPFQKIGKWITRRNKVLIPVVVKT